MTKDDRLYGKFTLDFADNPKILPLSDAAFRCLVEATLYSRRMMSDGFLASRLAVAKWGADVLAELCENDAERPSLEKVDKGYLIRDYAEHQDTKVEIEARRLRNQLNGSLGGQARAKRLANQPAKRNRSDSQAETETETHHSSTKSVNRASRIPEPFIVTKAMREWAATEVPGMNVDATTRQFVDYWRASSSRTAVKKDWLAAWRYWLRKDSGDARPAKLTPEQRARQTLALAGNLKELE
jgi:hypothetical protein